MNPEFRERLLDRLAELTKGNEQRTMEYLGMAQSTVAERQRKLTEQREAKGMARTALWAPKPDLEALKRAYPGQRGGIDWKAVITAALDKAREKKTGDAP